MSKLSQKQFDAVTHECLDDLMVKELGFEFLRGTYFRELPSGLRQLLIVDYAPEKRAFFPIIGLNASLIAGDGPPDEAGAYVVKYLTPGGLSERPRELRAHEVNSARDSMNRLRQGMLDHGLNWYRGFETLSDLAEVMPEHYDFLKGKLLLADGKASDAMVWLRRYEFRLRAMPQDEEVAQAMKETAALIAQCGVQVPKE